jgi:hypothetical protein
MLHCPEQVHEVGASVFASCIVERAVGSAGIAGSTWAGLAPGASGHVATFLLGESSAGCWTRAQANSCWLPAGC